MDKVLNPYASPLSTDDAQEPERNDSARVGGSWRLAIGWCAAFALNMPVPLFFGGMGTNDSGRVGMLLGVGLLMSAGFALVRYSQAIGQTITWGGVLFAVTQFFPIAQIMIGMITAGAIHHLGYSDPLAGARANGLGLSGELLATLIAGSLMLIAIGTVGLLLRLVTPAHWWAPLKKGAPSTEPNE